ncbi:MAG: ABC transporter substrate-binding protein [Lachnospiraceae bacterium]|nr:ABC transporter substrate-binding protein [Lachnospiraceae bacterium]
MKEGKTRKRRLRRTLALLLALITVLSGCGSSSSGSTDTATTAGESAATEAENTSTSEESTEAADSGEAQYGGDLRVTITADPASLDVIMEDVVDAQIPGYHIFETAICNDASGNIYPQVCTYEETDNQVILKVRDGVTFHNGNAVTIEDVEASAVRWLANVSSAETYVGSVLESMEIVDDTLVFTFTEPAPLATTVMAFYDQGLYIMPKEICEKYPDSKIADEDLIGTGPYKFVEHQADRYILVEKYEDYQPIDNGDATGMAATRMAYVDHIYFYPVGDKSARVNGLLTDEYDIIIGAPENMRETIEADENTEVVLKSDEIFAGLIFNCAEGSCTDVNLRNAILACLDMDALMLAAQGSEDLYVLNPGVMSVNSKWYTDESLGKYNNVDLEAAKEYLEQSSYDGEELVFITTKDNDYFYKTALALSEMVAEIGINIDLQVYDNATLKEYRMDSSKYDMCSVGLGSKVDPTQIAFLESGWAGFYESEQKDALIEQMMAETDFDTRYDLWVELTKVLYEELPNITFGERLVVVGMRTDIHNLYEGTQKYYWNTWMEQ